MYAYMIGILFYVVEVFISCLQVIDIYILPQVVLNLTFLVKQLLQNVYMHCMY